MDVIVVSDPFQPYQSYLPCAFVAHRPAPAYPYVHDLDRRCYNTSSRRWPLVDNLTCAGSALYGGRRYLAGPGSAMRLATPVPPFFCANTVTRSLTVT